MKEVKKRKEDVETKKRMKQNKESCTKGKECLETKEKKKKKNYVLRAQFLKRIMR
jgi:hypothetical protein